MIACPCRDHWCAAPADTIPTGWACMLPADMAPSSHRRPLSPLTLSLRPRRSPAPLGDAMTVYPGQLGPVEANATPQTNVGGPALIPALSLWWEGGADFFRQKILPRHRRIV